MYVSPSYRLVYVAAPRTGSTEIVAKLCQEPFQAQLFGDKSSYDTTWHPTLEHSTVVTTVRHPYVRAVSLWQFTRYQAICRNENRLTQLWRRIYVKSLPSLAEFLQFPELQTLLGTIWRCSWHQERIPKPIDHVIHLERFEEDLARVPELKDTVFPRFKPGPSLLKPWHSFFTNSPVCVELVQQLWSDDFDEFGYTRDLEATIAGQIFTRA